MREPTQIQIATVRYWYEYFHENGYYPTIREARTAFKCVSTNAIYDRLLACMKKGLMFTRQRDGRWMLTNDGFELCEGQEGLRQHYYELLGQ